SSDLLGPVRVSFFGYSDFILRPYRHGSAARQRVPTQKPWRYLYDKPQNQGEKDGTDHAENRKRLLCPAGTAGAGACAPWTVGGYDGAARAGAGGYRRTAGAAARRGQGEIRALPRAVCAQADGLHHAGYAAAQQRRINKEGFPTRKPCNRSIMCTLIEEIQLS